MHAQNKFYHKTVSEQRIVASVAKSLVSDFDSTYFKSKNNAFLVKWKFGNSFFLTQDIRNKKVM